MHRYILTALGCFALATAFSMAPIGLQDASITLGAKTALAQNGGKGKGKGKGQARGQMKKQALNGLANGHSGETSANGRALGHEIDGVSGVGHDTAPGQVKKASYDGMYDKLEVEGSFNAIHSAAINKELPPQSRVAQVRAYLERAKELSQLSADAPTLDAAIRAAAEAAVTASSQPVTKTMLDEVNAFSNKRGLTDPEIDPLKDRTMEVAEEAGKI